MIIDSHVHVGGDEAGFCMNEEMVLKSMEKYQIDISIVSNGDSVEYGDDLKRIPKEMQINQEETLARVIRFCRENPGKIYGGFWCKPHYEVATDAIDKMIAENRDVIVALKVHPTLSNLSFTDEKMHPYLKLAEKYQLPVIVHTADDEVANPMRVYEMACLYPQLNFIMAHMGLGSDNVIATELIALLPNLFGDTAWVPMESTINFIKKIGSQKLFFGTDLPIDGIDTYHHNPRGERSLYQDYFEKLPEFISQEDYDNLMWKNALTFFGLE